MPFILKGAALACAALFPLLAAAHSGHGHAGNDAHSAHHGQATAHGHAADQRVFPDPAGATPPQGVTLHDCWIRALPNRLPAAGYFRLENTGEHDAVLIGAQAEGFGSVMLHTHQTVGGLSSMVHVDKVVVPASGTFEFAPGGHHLMLEKPTIDLKVGTQHPVVLWFEGERAISAACDVKPPGTLK